MKTLSPVSEKTVTRILSKVRFEDRFIGGRMRQRAGIRRVTAYSFKEVIGLLNDQMPMVHFGALEKWFRVVMGDEELADKIAKAVGERSDYLNTVVYIKDLMEERLTQCQKKITNG